jgi:aarF domain-containing kinase
MEYIDGIKIDETEALAKKFGSAKSCSDILLDVFAKMIFVDGHIHCDAHPGNILVRPNPKTNKP